MAKRVGYHLDLDESGWQLHEMTSLGLYQPPIFTVMMMTMMTMMMMVMMMMRMMMKTTMMMMRMMMMRMMIMSNFAAVNVCV